MISSAIWPSVLAEFVWPSAEFSASAMRANLRSSLLWGTVRGIVLQPLFTATGRRCLRTTYNPRMNPLHLFLREHAAAHTQAVAAADPFNMDYLVEGLTDTQVRARPHGLNSLAWIFWHVARVEDGFVSCIVLGQDQLFDLENWDRRLAAPTRDVSTSKEQVAELSNSIDIESLWAYRNAVGRRTREGLQALWPDRWDEPIGIADVRRAV